MRLIEVMRDGKGPWQSTVWTTRKVGLFTLVGIALVVLAMGCGNKETQQTINGSQIYQANCASCHGLQGEGQPGWLVPRPDGSYAPPPHDKTGHTWHHADGFLFRYTKDGGASLNIPNFSSGMPAFGQQLEDEEIRAVINHLKTFWEPGQREGQRLASENDPFPE